MIGFSRHTPAATRDPDHLWIVVGTSDGQVTLPDDASFFAWAHENWPAPRWSVELEPHQLAPWLRSDEGRQ
jgi:hypothetical protein